MKMIACTCDDDYKIKVTGPVTKVAIAPGATFAAAQDASGAVCDATAPAPRWLSRHHPALDMGRRP